MASLKDKKGFNYFLKNKSRRGKTIDIRKKTVVKFALASEYDVYKRNIVRFPVILEESKDGGVTYRRSQKVLVSPDSRDLHLYDIEPRTCIVKEFLEYLAGRADLDNDETIFEIKKGDAYEIITKGEILGERDYDFKLSMKMKSEWIYAVVDLDDVEAGVQIFQLPWGAGESLKVLINEQLEDLGEEDGDPWAKPCPFRVKYNEDEAPAKKYGFGFVRSPKYIDILKTEDTKDVLNSNDLEIKEWVTPYDHKMETDITALLKKYIAGGPCEDFFKGDRVKKESSPFVKNEDESEKTESKKEETKEEKKPEKKEKPKKETKKETKKEVKKETKKEVKEEAKEETKEETKKEKGSATCEFCSADLTKADIDLDECGNCASVISEMSL